MGSWSRTVVAALFAAGCGATHAAGVDGGMDAAAAPPDASSLDGRAEDADAGPGCRTPLTEAERATWHERIRRAYCERIEPCDDGFRWPDVETCMRLDMVAHMVANEWLAFEGGDTVLDTDAVARCLEQLECPYSRSTSQTYGWIVDGEPSWGCEPTVRRRCDAEPPALGDACAWYDTCPDGSFCGHETCGHVCVPRMAPGAPCDYFGTDACPRGPGGELALCFRQSATEELTCRFGRPTSPAAVGEPCGPMGAPGETMDLVPCADGLRCLPVGDGELPRTCVALQPRGGACNEAGCVIGLWCDYESFTCQDPRILAPVEIGDACSDVVLRDHCDDQWGTQCVDDVCGESRGEGQPCDDNDWSRMGFAYWPGLPCDPPLFCGAESTCVRPRLLGADCSHDDECASRCCSVETSRCIEAESCVPVCP